MEGATELRPLLEQGGELLPGPDQAGALRVGRDSGDTWLGLGLGLGLGVGLGLETVAIPRTGSAMAMPSERPASPMNWCLPLRERTFLPPTATSAPPETRRKTEAEGWPSSCSVAPLRSVVHVPACSSSG